MQPVLIARSQSVQKKSCESFPSGKWLARCAEPCKNLAVNARKWTFLLLVAYTACKNLVASSARFKYVQELLAQV